MKRNRVFLIAALISIMVCGTALAAAKGLRLADMFVGDEKVKEKVNAMVREVDQVFETDEVRVTVNDGLYSSQSSVVALSLTVENKTPGETYYIFERNFSVNGENVPTGMSHNFTEFTLGDEPVECATSRRLSPQSRDAVVEFDYVILKMTGTILPREDVIALRQLQDDDLCEAYYAKIRELTQEGYVVIEDDGVVETGMNAGDIGYRDMLLSSGNFAQVDDIHVTIPLCDTTVENWVYEGEKSISGDGVELIVEKLEGNVLSATVQVRVIVDDPVKYEDYWISIEQPGNTIEEMKDVRSWLINANGENTAFTPCEDGRYESTWWMQGYPYTDAPETLEIHLKLFDSQTCSFVEEEELIATLKMK